MNRSSGILLPVFSLPNDEGIGTFGKSAYEFIDYLNDMGVKYWQVLPMHPLTYGNSPYQSTSTFAGNIYHIDLDILAETGLLEKSEYSSLDFGDNENKVDYIKVVTNKKQLLRTAAKRFMANGDKAEYEKFINDFDYYLDDYTTFILIKDRYAGIEYSKWDRIHRFHYDEVIKEFYHQNRYEIEVYKVIQYFFFKQWLKLKKYANDKNIKIIGDMPIYSSYDSVEVFCDYKNFYLDDERRPIEVAGCPPDAFSADGQLWRNPLYDYDYMKKDGYRYFIKRVSHLHKLYDTIRIDHFRGFASYYAIKADSNNAKNGTWKMGPGIDIFNKFKEKIEGLDIIAEDLGYIDDYVRNLLKETGYPGMKVVEFAFGGDVENHPYLPKNYDENAVAYLGTHDNDTFVGWFDKANNTEKEQAIKYLHIKDTDDKKQMAHDAITELFKSKANLTIILMQDLLGHDTNARINIPSTIGDFNWSYRFKKDYLDRDSQVFLKELVKNTGR